jgi:ribonuclease P protein component
MKRNGKIIILLQFPALDLLFQPAVSIIYVPKIWLKQQVEIQKLWKERFNPITAKEKRRTVSENARRLKAADWCLSGGVPKGVKGWVSVDKVISERFPHCHRIVRSKDYRAIYSKGKKVHSEKFVLFGCENEVGHARLGITVSRKIGCASIRNRIKRLFREIFRRSSAEIPSNFDIVINAKSGCAGAGFPELREEFIAAAKRMARKGFS